ncbi:tripartite tricarboxylate transporter TctB family protein [Brevibacterium antiquum]|uniref:Tripartite tricarboxylate transporter TctB family protein n=1 Tax=Brevibacterium antiquum CNRZ 918 TaxID=1255637 RepID=A0A2H1L0D8_9MICO|nr:tripartite tricarboxylate transporter TctB family protein [Brevibacterium antiquum]SMY05398.1 Tripartite tricarboxylate transporter TctB family protein [Brevibacterium antiquum CNRZ 918]
METANQVKYRLFILRNGDRICAVGLLIVFVIFGIASSDLDYGTLRKLGPGFWPMALAVTGGALSIVLFAVGREVPILAKTGTFRTFIVTLGSMSFIPIGYYYLGFVPSATVSLFVMIYLLGPYKWWVALLTSVIGSVCVYVLFAIGLALPIVAL